MHHNHLLPLSQPPPGLSDTLDDRWMTKQVEDWLFTLPHNRVLGAAHGQRVTGLSAVSRVKIHEHFKLLVCHRSCHQRPLCEHIKQVVEPE